MSNRLTVIQNPLGLSADAKGMIFTGAIVLAGFIVGLLYVRAGKKRR